MNGRPPPPEAVLKTLQAAVEHLNARRWDEAKARAQDVCRQRPNDPSALNVLGCVAMERGEIAAAISHLGRAAKFQPTNPFIAFNLGEAHRRAGGWKEAATLYRRAIQLRGRFPQAEALLGDMLRKLDDLPGAEAAYRRALHGDPNHFAAQNGLGLCLQQAGRLGEAVTAFEAALRATRGPDAQPRASILVNLAGALLQAGDGMSAVSALTEAVRAAPERDEHWRLLARSLRHIRRAPATPGFKPILEALFERPDVNPRTLATAAVVTLRQDPMFDAALTRLRNEPPMAPLNSDLQAALTQPLFLALLGSAPIPDRDVEVSMIALRRRLLLARHQRTSTGAEQLPLVVALARQCFLNEYVYFVDDDEQKLVLELRRELSAAPAPAAIALAACYAPLPDLGIDPAPVGSELDVLVREQIAEPAREQELARSLASLAPVEDGVSIRVQAQYEANPYPRWIRAQLNEPQDFRAALQSRLPHLRSSQLPYTGRPRVLVAGCGTGLETMNVVTSFVTDSVLAVDLSRASLAYAMRKLAEYEFHDVKHLQADILHLDGLRERFDLVHSFGVIHHMADPARGLRVLANLLRPGGYIFLGLYSSIARASVRRARDLIQQKQIPATPAGIRAFRRRLLSSDADDELSPLTSPASDFWTLSECRDLMFHVEEHHFTLLEIGALLANAGLEFIGLEPPHPMDYSRFVEEYGKGAVRDLAAWHRFESARPETFGGTYRLWARKS